MTDAAALIDAEARMAKSRSQLVRVQQVMQRLRDEESLLKAEVERHSDTVRFLKLRQLTYPRGYDHYFYKKDSQAWEWAKTAAAHGCLGEETVALVRDLCRSGASGVHPEYASRQVELSKLAHHLAWHEASLTKPNTILLLRELCDEVFHFDDVHGWMRPWEDGELECCMRQWQEVVARLEEAGVDYSELSEKMADYQERYDNYDRFGDSFSD